MATIHGSLKYNSDLEIALFDEIELSFYLPGFSYEGDRKKVNRINEPSVEKDVVRSLNSRSYEVDYPSEFITSDMSELFIAWIRRKMARFSLDQFKLNIPYTINGPNRMMVAKGNLTAFFSFVTTAATDDSPSLGTLTSHLDTSLNVESTAALSPRLFLINAKELYSLLKKVQSDIHADSDVSKEFCLLRLISELHRSIGERPILHSLDERPTLQPLGEQEVEDIIKRMQRQGITFSSNTVKEVVQRVEQLLSFPIEIDEISIIRPAGTFHITTQQGNYPRSELSFYRITAEAVIQSGKDEHHYRAWEIDCSNLESADPVSEPLQFDLQATPAIITSSIDGPVLVRVIAFDGTTLWRQSYEADSDDLSRIEIVIDAYLPGQLFSDESGRAESSRRIRGQVLSTDRSRSVGGLTVVIQAKEETGDLWRVVCGGTTGSSGHFSLSYPKGQFIAAQALVSVAPNSAVDIEILDTGIENETISDDYLFLLVDGYSICDESGCSSDSVSRLPDHADLIGSGEFSQDLGGNCVNVTRPNRTLREYNYNAIVRVSDPDVANYTLEKTEDGFRLSGGARVIDRSIIDLSNPVRWQDAPEAGDDSLNFYQSVTVATGHILFYKVEFKADGYSLGDLTYSLPLAPGQKKQIVSYDMANTLEASESQRLSQGEQLTAELLDERIITDELSGGINESLEGRSSASTAGVSAGLGIGVSVGSFGGSLGVSGGYSNSRSSASQSGARDISQSFAERLRQMLMQNAESYRELTTSVVTTVKEGQEYAVSTEVVANHNHCHSVTLMFFEVLRHYAISQKLADVQECVFVPLLLTEFTPEKISKWKDVLATNLLPIPSNTYLQPPWFAKYIRRHPLSRAFDANERIKTDYERVDFPDGRYADDAITSISGELRLRIRLPRPRTGFDRILSLPVISTKKKTGVDKERSLLSWAPGGDRPGIYYKKEDVLEATDISNEFMQLDANYQTVPPARAIRVLTFQPQEIDGDTVDGFDNNLIDKGHWEIYANIIGIFSDVYEFMDKYFANRLICEWDRIFNEDIAPLIFNTIIDSIKIDPLNLDFTNMGTYAGGERSVRLRLSGRGHPIRSTLPEEMRIYSNSDQIHSLRELPFFKLNIENVRIQYSTAHFNGYIFNGYVGNDLLDADPSTSGAIISTPLTPRDKRDPHLEDQYMVEELFDHLNSNLEHYNKVLWKNLDPDRRYMLLDGFNIQVYDRAGTSLGFRSLASVVKNDLITIVGNSLVFPVADGYHVGRTHVIERTDENPPSLLDHYRPTHEVEPYRLSVPTRGVYTESVMGKCDACEEVKENSSQDWDRFRTEEPTAIAPVTTPTPERTNWRAIWAQFAQPLVALQTAREMPAPGAGLEGLSDALTNTESFRDVTGLAGNQENVIRTYLSNQENARAFAEMAKTMAMQEHNSENSRSIMQSLDTARERGAISDENYSELVRDHLGQQIDGGSRCEAEDRRESAREPSLTNAAIDAVEQGREVNAQRTDTNGTTESLQVSSSEATEDIETIFYDVPLIPQPDSNSCWIATMAMIDSYRRRRNDPESELLTVTALAEELELSLDETYSWADLEAAKERLGFEYVRLGAEGRDQPPSPDKWKTWIQVHGPLYITVEGDPSHAIVVHGIRGNLTLTGCYLDILNPAPVNQGRPESLTVAELNEAFTTGDLSHLAVYSNWRILYHPDLRWASVETTGEAASATSPAPAIPNVVMPRLNNDNPGLPSIPANHPPAPNADDPCPTGCYGVPTEINLVNSPSARTMGTRLNTRQATSLVSFVRSIANDFLTGASGFSRPLSAELLLHWLDGQGRLLQWPASRFAHQSVNIQHSLIQDSPRSMFLPPVQCALNAFTNGAQARLLNPNHSQGSLLPYGTPRFMQWQGRGQCQTSGGTSGLTSPGADLGLSLGYYYIHSVAWVTAEDHSSSHWRVNFSRWCVQVYDIIDFNAGNTQLYPVPENIYQRYLLQNNNQAPPYVIVGPVLGNYRMLTVSDDWFRNIEVSTSARKFLLYSEPFPAPGNLDQQHIDIPKNG